MSPHSVKETTIKKRSSNPAIEMMNAAFLNEPPNRCNSYLDIMILLGGRRASRDQACNAKYKEATSDKRPSTKMHIVVGL